MSDASKIKGGQYELVALRWDEITSKPGQPLDFVRHYRGDTVTLSAAEARRLVLAGAVKKPGDDGEDEVPGSEQSVAPGEPADLEPPAQTPADASASEQPVVQADGAVALEPVVTEPVTEPAEGKTGRARTPRG